ncbi:DUF433 domain-containing protein [Dehalococcoidia bacterium]|nr:DUF433 domain-containing protein [Dehalococcoidia bacterium]
MNERIVIDPEIQHGKPVIRGTRVPVTRIIGGLAGGKPVAALVAIENADMETVSLSANPGFLSLIERSRVRQQAEGGISSEEMRRRLGLSQ